LSQKVPTVLDLFGSNYSLFTNMEPRKSARFKKNKIPDADVIRLFQDGNESDFDKYRYNVIFMIPTY